MTFARLLAEAGQLVASGGRRILGIAGAPGSGKSRLAAALADALGERVRVVGMDGFHLAQAELIRLGRQDHKGAPDTFDVLGFVALLTRLRENLDEVVYAPCFDRALEEPIGCAVAVRQDVPLVIVEGNYLLVDDGTWGGVRPLLDRCWYLDPGEQIRRAQLIARHRAYGRSPAAAREYALGSDERNACLIAAWRSRADLIVHSLEYRPGSGSDQGEDHHGAEGHDHQHDQ
ncbi:MAG: nucleoside/nucleotide kinase family protein [Actinobacteria bacterium]|nr:nucleoside/nucleotide kinase family protein [Actinomycetota bacterium]